MPQGVPPKRPAEPTQRFSGAAGHLIRYSHRCPPDQLAHLFRVSAARAGLADAAIYLADLDQRWLVPLQPGGLPLDPLEIDGTIAGRTFQFQRVLAVPLGTGERAQLWVPVLDGVERLGVISVIADVEVGAAGEDVGDRMGSVEDARLLASILAELLVSMREFGDVVERARRREPMELAAELRWTNSQPLTAASLVTTIAAALAPAYRVAGDAFDYSIASEVVHLALLDAIGHDLQSARVANLAVAALRHARRHDAGGHDLVSLYRHVDEALRSVFGEASEFVTAQLVMLQERTGELRWICAGHPNPLLVRRGRVVGELSAERTLPIGLNPKTVTVAHRQLEPGDQVLYYSDGVTEARNDRGELYGVDRLVNLLGLAAAAQVPPAETVRRLSHGLVDRDGARFQDDATLMLLSWEGPPPLVPPWVEEPGD